MRAGVVRGSRPRARACASAPPRRGGVPPSHLARLDYQHQESLHRLPRSRQLEHAEQSKRAQRRQAARRHGGWQPEKRGRGERDLDQREEHDNAVESIERVGEVPAEAQRSHLENHLEKEDDGEYEIGQHVEVLQRVERKGGGRRREMGARARFDSNALLEPREATRLRGTCSCEEIGYRSSARTTVLAMMSAVKK